MYARIVDNKIKELCALNHSGESGWKLVADEDVGKGLTYDTGTSKVRQTTDAEKATEHDRVVLEGAWYKLRSVRDNFLLVTDAYAVGDRPATTNMPEYREYLRDLPEDYNDTSILTQDDVMDFDAYVASL